MYWSIWTWFWSISSAPGLASKIWLKKPKIRFELLTNIYMLLTVQKRIKRGICHVIRRYAKANMHIAYIWMVVHYVFRLKQFTKMGNVSDKKNYLEIHFNRSEIYQVLIKILKLQKTMKKKVIKDTFLK